MRSGVHPHLLVVFQVSIFAPFSARKWTTFGKLLYAAPCIAVSPFRSTTLTFAPNVRRYLTASRHSPSVPASSSGARQPSPAAAINGVDPSAFGVGESAPRSTNNFIKGRSAVFDAIRNGVASLSESLPRPLSPFFKRAFTSAPLAKIWRTKSRLVSFPDPSGGG